MSSLAMAILLNGMNRREISRWTSAMIASGERMDFSSLSRPTSDKHSTGGVGDKITLPLAPLVAACGVAVPQLSGRGLGHTGGTLDKLESIPGWRAALSNAEMLAQLEDVGAVICAAGTGLAPADRKLYALRDVTGTVEAIPLIASSIMSKKIAEGTGALVLDVKVGSGAFMKDADRARELARTMVDLGTDAGVRTVALLTDMSTPLGLTVGNALEVAESVEVLAGGGPPDVVELTVALAREMLAAVGRSDVDVSDALADGRAMDVWRRMIAAQGGDPDAALPVARESEQVLAPADGVLVGMDALAVGVAAWRLGAGRARKEDVVQAGAGIELHAKPGAQVRAGEPLMTLHTDTPERFERARAALAGAPAGALTLLATAPAERRLSTRWTAANRRSAATALFGLPWPAALGTPPWGAARVARFPGVTFHHQPVDDTDQVHLRRVLDAVEHAPQVALVGVIHRLVMEGHAGKAGHPGGAPRWGTQRGGPGQAEQGSRRRASLEHPLDGGEPTLGGSGGQQGERAGGGTGQLRRTHRADRAGDQPDREGRVADGGEHRQHRRAAGGGVGLPRRARHRARRVQDRRLRVRRQGCPHPGRLFRGRDRTGGGQGATADLRSSVRSTVRSAGERVAGRASGPRPDGCDPTALPRPQTSQQRGELQAGHPIRSSTSGRSGGREPAGAMVRAPASAALARSKRSGVSVCNVISGSPARTCAPGLACSSIPAPACTTSSLRARPAPSRQAATPTASASSPTSTPSAGASTWSDSRATGSAASGSPP